MNNDSKLIKYMAIAQAVAALSKDTTQVGALIIGPAFEIRSVGYNGAPRGCAADEDDRRLAPEKYHWWVHSEENAILNAARVGTPLEGCTIIVTHHPCVECAKSIVQAGIKTVVIGDSGTPLSPRFKPSTDRAAQLFEECGVVVRKASDIKVEGHADQ